MSDYWFVKSIDHVIGNFEQEDSRIKIFLHENQIFSMNIGNGNSIFKTCVL